MTRGTGLTSQQMQNAPLKANFVVMPGILLYAKHLAQHLGRNDLKIQSSNWVEHEYYRGLERGTVILDHAVTLSNRAWQAYAWYQTPIEKPEVK